MLWTFPQQAFEMNLKFETVVIYNKHLNFIGFHRNLCSIFIKYSRKFALPSEER